MKTINAKLPAAQFSELISNCRDSVASLRGCRREERPNEAAILRRVLNELCGVELARRNDRLEDRRREMVKCANELLAVATNKQPLRRKVVYWVNQKTTEAFTMTHGTWQSANHLDWPVGRFDYIEIRASDDDFRSRRDGCVML